MPASADGVHVCIHGDVRRDSLTMSQKRRLLVVKFMQKSPHLSLMFADIPCVEHWAFLAQPRTRPSQLRVRALSFFLMMALVLGGGCTWFTTESGRKLPYAGEYAPLA